MARRNASTGQNRAHFSGGSAPLEAYSAPTDLNLQRSLPLLNQLHELGEAVHYPISDLLRGDPAEEFARTFDLRFFDLSEVHGSHRPLCLRHEVHMPDRTLLESDRPVRGISAHWSGN